MGWLIRGLLFLSGFIASLFVAREALNFQVVQMVIAVLLLTLVLIVLAFFPYIEACILGLFRKKK